MKLLVTSEEIVKEFKRLIESYDEFYWASAWAGVGSECFDELKKNKQKIKKIVIGTHFNQTDPKFIEEFMETKNVKFIKQYAGIFHPKVYLFQNNRADWKLLIGSMNFTSSGFSKNTEVLVLITKEEDKTSIYDKLLGLITERWNSAEYFSEKELKGYTTSWENQQRRSGKYGKAQGTPIADVEIMNWSWQDFVQKIKEREKTEIEGRLEVLKKANEAFTKYTEFKSMPQIVKKGIAGILLRNKQKECSWDWFGHLKPRLRDKRVRFGNTIICDENISLALDQIPQKGHISESNYKKFLEYFEKAFPDTDELSAASRLLTMKRPDKFVLINTKNRKTLCEAFGIKESNVTCKTYWPEIIERICDSEWWKSPCPENEEDKQIWEGRSALLDAIYYEYE